MAVFVPKIDPVILYTMIFNEKMTKRNKKAIGITKGPEKPSSGFFRMMDS
ncbi:MAG TPA: hypothetical protein VJ855_07530 [Marinilabiliaceae bacterium]|nr:hypothetical protein [Marinilabiliaceae bacterium]